MPIWPEVDIFHAGELRSAQKQSLVGDASCSTSLAQPSKLILIKVPIEML